MNICYSFSGDKLELSAFIDDEGILTYILGIGENIQIFKENNKEDKYLIRMIKKYFPGNIEKERIKILCTRDSSSAIGLKTRLIYEQTKSETLEQDTEFTNKYAIPMLQFFRQLYIDTLEFYNKLPDEQKSQSRGIVLKMNELYRLLKGVGE